MSKYKTMSNLITNEPHLVVRDDGAMIPFDELNPDYLEYVAWLFEGNTPEEWQPESETE